MALGLLALVVGLITGFIRYYNDKKPVMVDGVPVIKVTNKPYTYFLYAIGGFLLFILSAFIIQWFAAFLKFSYQGNPALLLVQDAISMKGFQAIRYLTPPVSILLLQASAICLMLSGGHKWLVIAAKTLALLAFIVFIPALVVVPVA